MMQEQKVAKFVKLVLAGGVALSVVHCYAQEHSSVKTVLSSQPSNQGATKDEASKTTSDGVKVSTLAPLKDSKEEPKKEEGKGDVKPAPAATVQPSETAHTAEAAKSSPPTKFDINQGFSALAEKTVPAVVNVSTTQVIDKREKGGVPQFPPGSPFDEFFKDFFDQMEQRPRRVTSLGSGFIIKSDESAAYVVTNSHVVADAKEITVFTDKNLELKAEIIAIDERTDIALLKIKTDMLPADQRKLPTVEWGDSHKAKVGDWVLAIGNPFGLGSTVTSGIISNRSRDIGMRGSKTSRVSEYVDDFMQHDASINMGNSGGPLFNLEGKVIGINTAIFSPSGGNVGIGFAIPSAVAAETVKQLIEFGRTKRGWLGVRIQMVTDDVAESLGLGKAHGAIVGKVTPHGPAANGGIEPGDIILEFDGKEIGDKARLSRIVGETEVGKKVKVKLLRKGKEINTEVVLGEFETSADSIQQEQNKGDKGQAPTTGVEVIGIRVAESKKHDLKDQKGVVVTDIDSETPAALLLSKGDIILEVNQQEVKTPEDFKNLIEDAKKKGRKNVLLLVQRQGDVTFVPIRLEGDDEKDSHKDSHKESSKK